MRSKFLVLLLINPFFSFSQLLTLDQAYELARQNYPLIKQKDFIQQTADLNIKNLGTAYLPKFSLNGQASYQSGVTKVSLQLPGIKINSLSRDQYKVTADINQLVFDGGLTREQKFIQELNATVENQKIEVELYKLKDRINQLYLGILFLDQQIKQIDLVKEDLEIGIKKVKAQVQNGVALKSNLNLLKAELLKSDQRLIELKAGREGLVETLGLFLNQTLDEKTVLEVPKIYDIKPTAIARPEIELFGAQTKLTEHQHSLIHAKNLPNTGLFLQGGYGRPALNMLENKFDWYYIAGVRLTWPIAGFYTSKREKQLVNINEKIIELQKQTFLLNTNTQLKQQEAEIEKLIQLVASDIEIIELRKSVKEAARVQLENGVITANDYLTEVNAEDQARQVQITHQLQLLQAQINYQTIIGK